jgi:hypothetical protein
MKLKIISSLIFVVAILVLLGFFGVQYIYHNERGNYLSVGLNLEVTREEASFGIPGQKYVYSAKLINFGVLPVKIAGCDYTSDTMSEETDYPYGIQKFNPNSKEWETILAITTDEFCRPMPTHGGGNHMVTKTLLPSDSILFIPDEATGARKPFKKGDQARFVAFRRLGENAWSDAVYSEPFIIEDDVLHDDNLNHKIAH